MCKQVKGKNQSETIQLYCVLALFDKHYSKWYICEDNSKVWYHSFPKGKYLLLDCMVEEEIILGTIKMFLLRIQMNGIHIQLCPRGCLLCIICQRNTTQ